MHHSIFILILILFNALISYPIEADSNSNSFNLVHHDSRFSPFYNRSMTESELLRKSYIRSLDRLNQFNSSMYIDGKYIGSSDLTKLEGEYHMDVYLGTPKEGESKEGWPKKLVAFPSMSDYLTVLPCKSESHYDRRKSSTYVALPFDSKRCKTMHGTKSERSDECQYRYESDKLKSIYAGILSTEKFYFKSSDDSLSGIPDMAFGCVDADEDSFTNSAIQCVFGLGPGPLSLVSQMKRTNGDKFSYCLVRDSMNHSSKIRFGSDVKLYHYLGKENRASFTYDPPHPFYYLKLQAISIKGEKIGIGGIYQAMIVDIQTSLTTLHPTIFDSFMDRFRKAVGNVESVEHQSYDNCFKKSELGDFTRLPQLAFHFNKPVYAGGVLLLDPINYLVGIDGYYCMTIVPKQGLATLGSRAQINYQMLFDLSSKEVKFAQIDCLAFAN